MKKNPIISILTASVLIVLACQSPLTTATATLTPATSTASATQTETPAPTLTASATLAPIIKRVLIVSFDGLRPDAIAAAPMPSLEQLMQGGAYSLRAQTTYPSLTLPAHTSMLTGECPYKHKVTWNDYIPENGIALGTDLFDLAYAAGLRTVMIVGKLKLAEVITAPESLSLFEFHPEGESVIAARAADEMRNGFGVMFVHFPTPDLQGHEFGWMSEEQFASLREADGALGVLLAGLNLNGLRETTLVIVTADHGGHDTTHGTDSLEDMTIPWVISGPGVISQELSIPIHTMDTAATAAFMLNLVRPAEWDGLPVLQAFGLPSPVRGPLVCR